MRTSGRSALGAFLLSAGLVVVVERHGHACGAPCGGALTLPASNATIPADAPALLWLSGVNPSPTTYRLVEEGPSGETPVPTSTMASSTFGTLVVPSAPLTPGKTYALVTATVCRGGTGTLDGTALRTRFLAGPNAPVPTTLGTLSAAAAVREPQLVVSTNDGSCNAPLDAMTATVSLQLDPSAAPWSELFEFSTFVDGQRWSPSSGFATALPPPFGGSWIGRGQDKVYVRCGGTDIATNPGLSPGDHTVEIRATLPGVSGTLASSTAQVTLRCPGASDGSDGGGCSVGGRDENGVATTAFFTLFPLLAAFRRGARR